MTQLTQEQFAVLQGRAGLIFQNQDSKQALILGRELEQTLPRLADNSSLDQKYQTLTWQLKWLGLSLMQDSREYTELFQNHFLEGLAMPEGDLNGPARITGLKIKLMFDIGVREFLNDILSALSKNKQRIGRERILVSGESALSQPTIQNWLLDFVRSAPRRQTINEMAAADYLFNNANAEKLSPAEKNLLGRLLNFYSDFRQLNKIFTAMEKEAPAISYLQNTAPRGDELYGAAPTAPVLQKTLRQLAKDNKDALNQILTGAPIKIAGFDQPTRPSIKNWLVDYVKIKGAGHHGSPERSDYLFNNANARALKETERALLSGILEAYDNDITLPVDNEKQTILIDLLQANNPSSVKPPLSTPFVKAPSSTPPFIKGGREGFNSNAKIPEQSIAHSYREPISQEDLAGPLKPPPPSKPAPRLNGNVIDLSDVSDKR